MDMNGDAKKSKKANAPPKQPKKLVLFFDGTGNKFCGNGSDTNIVKLHNMMNRETEGQFHYYQPGIGTYVPGSNGPMNPGPIGKRLRKVSQGLDQGFGSSFDAHVIAGYRFLMRYYKPNAWIYIFGFSRGAFTARFLASLITHVGLLSMGNEELIPFAYEQYLEAGKRTTPLSVGEVSEMETFKKTFCRPAVVIKFLGLFDSVSSVALFDFPGTGMKTLPGDLPIADNIRHAVALDEGRTKFKPALMGTEDQEKAWRQQLEDAKAETKPVEEIMNEVWFAGNHGDIGGGWEPYYWYYAGTKTVTDSESVQVPIFKEEKVPTGSTTRYRPTGKTETKKLGASYNVYKPGYQLSDITLEWMLKEMDKCLKVYYPDKGKYPDLKFDERLNFKIVDKTTGLTANAQFIKNMENPENREQALTNFRHNCLAWNGGPKKTKVIFWWLLEIMPGLKHIELVGNGWVPKYTPNLGSKRDIPIGSTIHPTVMQVRPEGKPLDRCQRRGQLGWVDAAKAAQMDKVFDLAEEPNNKPWWKRAVWVLPLIVALAFKPVMNLFSREPAYSRLD